MEDGCMEDGDRCRMENAVRMMQNKCMIGED